MYIAYKCKQCKRIFVLLADEVEANEKKGKYLTCPYHAAHRNIEEIDKYDDLRDCMKHSSYKKEKGRVKQRGWGSD